MRFKLYDSQSSLREGDCPDWTIDKTADEVPLVVKDWALDVLKRNEAIAISINDGPLECWTIKHPLAA